MSLPNLQKKGKKMKEELAQRILNSIIGQVDDPERVKGDILIILKDYSISPAETALSIRNEDKNNWYLQRFIIAKTVKGCTEKTLNVYKNEIKKALDSIGKNAEEITADDIRLFLAIKERKEGWSRTTCDNTLRFLRSFYNYLTVEELIDKNPTLKIDKIKSPKVQRKAFEELEVEKIRDVCRNTKETVVIELLLSTGCRVSELVGVKISEVNANQVLVHGKGQKDRTVYLNAKAVLAVQKYLAERKDNNPYLFPKVIFGNEAGNKGKMKKLREAWKYPELIIEGHMDKSSVEQMVRRIGKRAGVDNVHPHRFRRTCATYALRHGMPIEQVSKMLGHEQLDTTKIYLDQDEKLLEEAHRRYVV